MTDVRIIVRTLLAKGMLPLAILLFASAARCQEQATLALFAANFVESQTQSPQSSNPAAPANADQQPNGQTPDASAEEQKKNDRMFFVMPNYLTVRNEAQVPPLSWRGKFAITASGAFDPYEFFTAGIVAGIRQAENAYPAFGQGAAGYGKRYGTAFADQVDANMMVGAVFPSILRTDPRYYQMGTGTFFDRFMYAISRIFVTRKDSGGNTFNLSEPLGNGIAIGISNLYYPAANRSLSSNINGWGLQMAIDGLGNELKEFWPDIHRVIERKRHRPDPPPPNDTH